MGYNICMDILPFEKTIRLKNSGSLELFFLGTGSAFSKKYFQTNLLIIKGNDHLLVDCGTLCPLAFYEYNTKLAAVDNLLITHSHADHIGGIEEIALIAKYFTNKKVNVIITDEYKKVLWNESLRGGMSYGEFADGHIHDFESYFEQIKPRPILKSFRPMYETCLGEMNIKMFRTKHIPNSKGDWKQAFFSCGILIDETVLFTGDTRFDKELIETMLEKYPTIETIFHDCQFFPGGVHASYDELKTLSGEIKEKMYLCHYGDAAEKYNPVNDGFAGFAKAGQYYSFN